MEFCFAATSIVPDGSLAFTLTVVIAGLSIVLGTLALLILIFSLFGKFTSIAEMKAEKNKQQSDTKKLPKPPEVKKVSEVPPPPEIVENGISPQIVAVISGAVNAYEGEGAQIVSIKRKNSAKRTQNTWAQAAVFENTKPF